MSAWSCTACTYRNTNAHSNTCEICESVRAIDLTSDSPIRSHEVQCQGVLIDDEDQDLKLALALSLEVDSPEKSQEMQTKQTLKTNTDLPNNDIGDILILSSKSKSPAPSLSPLATTARKRPRDEEDGIQVGKTIKRQADDGKSNPLQVNFDTTRSSDVIPSAITFGKTKRWNVPFQTYPKGHVSLTYVKGFSRAGFTRFEDLVQKDHLTKAFVSAFQIDDGWLNSKIPMHINLCVARTRFQDVPKDTSQLQVGPTRVFVFPPEGTGYSVMHIKLMILFFGEFVRIVVTSANLVEYDWELLENIVFCQDFGMKIDAVGSQPTPPSQFENDLTNILSEMQAPKQVLNAVGKVDFSTAQITLVPSRPGRFSGDDLYKWGHIRLLQATKPLRDEQLAKDSSFAPNVTYTTSSLGLLKLSWAKELHNSLVGVDPELPSTGESGGSKPGNRSNPLPIRVLYPTKKTVENSVLGAAGGGTISLQSKLYKSDLFHRSLLHDHNGSPSRQGALSHIKYILIWRDKHLPKGLVLTSKEKCQGWVYIGSHNATQSAWGALKRLKSHGASWQLQINNWELGVLLPVRESTGNGLDDEVSIPDVFSEPVQPYKAGDTPWICRD